MGQNHIGLIPRGYGMDRLFEIAAFIAVADAGGFSAAARHTGSSQPAISKALAGLERRLGTSLLNRSTRKVTVTDQGRRYYERMKPLIEAMDEAEAEVASSKNQLSGLIRISAPATLGRLHILPIIPELLQQNPGLEVDLILSDDMRSMLEDGIDLAIRIGPTNDLDAVVKRVAGTPVVCAGSRSYFERRGIPRTPDDLADHNCLLFGAQRESSEWPLRGPGGRDSITVRGNFSSNSIEAIRAAVLAGVGIGMMTRASLTSELSHPDIITVLDGFVTAARDINLVWRQRRYVPTRLRRTTEFLADALPRRLEGGLGDGLADGLADELTSAA